ncbi:MAG TPA: hypothetical protein PKY58_08080 [Syntrophales bacterium]|nr:hypothetical protein [Syntrophales bacterium]HQN76797.1 hypothetical protein [Syntrophales bacterium]HQQ27471.1 hypothetical protein [Syntrophales bacterium]
MQFDTDEIIQVRIGKSLSRNYAGYKGTFAALVYNSLEKKALPGFHEKGLVAGAEMENETLSLRLSGNRPDDALMEIMDIVLRNVSAFPREGGEARFSITIG